MMTSRSAPPTTPPSSQLSLLALVLGFFVADVGGNGAVWNPSEVWTHYAPRRGEPRHHTHVGCYNNPGGVLDPIFPDGKKTVADLDDPLEEPREGAGLLPLRLFPQWVSPP